MLPVLAKTRLAVSWVFSKFSEWDKKNKNLTHLSDFIPVSKNARALFQRAFNF